MPFITVNQSGPDIADGVYPVILVDIRGPKTVTVQRGPKAGQEIELYDWVFAIDAGPGEGTEIEASTSTASGPRSKMYNYLTALFSGVAPAVGSSFEKTDLLGRRALATIRRDEAGWPRIENLGAMPAGMQQQAFAQATGLPPTPPAAPTPAAAAAAAGQAAMPAPPAPGAPLRDQVAQPTPDLPF